MVRNNVSFFIFCMFIPTSRDLHFIDCIFIRLIVCLFPFHRPVMKRPRMSASDSDYSIDWLASDDEEHNSELETKYDQEEDTLPTTPAAQNSCGPQTCWKSSDHSVKVKEDRSCRSSPPSSPTSSFSNGESDPSLLGQEDMSDHICTPGSPKGKSRQAQKRSRCLPVPKQNEKQLTASPTEKDKLFACKVWHVVFQAHSVQGECQFLGMMARITHMI